MVVRTRYLAWLLTLPAVLVGCGDRMSPAEPEVAQESAASRPAAELSAGMRAVMTKTIAAALAEADLQPDASMLVLQEFFEEVDARRASRHDAEKGHP